MSDADRSPEASLEEQIAALHAQLERAERLTALGELSGTITHEFNNVLMKFIGYAQMGLRHKDDATREKAFETILSVGQRTKRMIACILGMARNRSETREATDMVPLVDDALLLLERELNKYRVRVDKQLNAVPPAMVNGNQIQQILVNLLINARQAMPDGGEVTIRLEHDAEARTVDLTVRDTGSGISQEKLTRIFDPFFSTKQPDASGKGGTGLGLAMCRRIVEAHQGRIRVQSTLGKGTSFTLKFPEAGVQQPGAPAAANGSASQQGVASAQASSPGAVPSHPATEPPAVPDAG